MKHSPDLDPIEKMWPKTNAFLRKLRIRSAAFLPDAVHKAQAANTIAAKLHLSRATVKYALDELCREGYVQRDHRWRENGSLSSNLYHIL